MVQHSNLIGYNTDNFRQVFPVTNLPSTRWKIFNFGLIVRQGVRVQAVIETTGRRQICRFLLTLWRHFYLMRANQKLF